jgi:hypothetical protein
VLVFRGSSPAEDQVCDLAAEGGIDRPCTQSQSNNAKVSVSQQSVAQVLEYRSSGLRIAHRGWVDDEFAVALLKLYQEAGTRGEVRPNFSLTSFFQIYSVHKAPAKIARELQNTVGKQSFDDVDVVFLPVHVADNHWILVVMDISHQDVHVYDSFMKHTKAWETHSMYDKTVQAVQAFVRGLFHLAAEMNDFNPERFDFARTDITTAPHAGMVQTDRKSCGVFMLTTARSIIEDRLPVFATDVKYQRRLLVCEAARGKLIPYAEHFCSNAPPKWRPNEVPTRPDTSDILPHYPSQGSVPDKPKPVTERNLSNNPCKGPVPIQPLSGTKTIRQLTPDKSSQRPLGSTKATRTKTRRTTLTQGYAKMDFISIPIPHFSQVWGRGMVNDDVASRTFCTAMFDRVRDVQPKYAYTVRALSACGLSPTIWITDTEQRNGKAMWIRHGHIKDSLYSVPPGTVYDDFTNSTLPAEMFVYRSLLSQGTARPPNLRPINACSNRLQIISGIKRAVLRLTTAKFPGPSWAQNSCHLDVFLLSELAFYAAHEENILAAGDKLPHTIRRLLRVLLTLGSYGRGLLNQNFARDDYREYEQRQLQRSSGSRMAQHYGQADYVWHGELLTAMTDAEGHTRYIEHERMLGCGITETCSGSTHAPHTQTRYITFVPLNKKWYPLDTAAAKRNLAADTVNNGDYGVDHKSYRDAILSHIVRPIGDTPTCMNTVCVGEKATRSYTKNVAMTRFPRSLELDAGAGDLDWAPVFTLKFGRVEYDLISITLRSDAHYVLLCKLNDIWYLYNDLKREKYNELTKGMATLDRIGYGEDKVKELIVRSRASRVSLIPRTWRYALRPASMDRNKGAAWDSSTSVPDCTAPCYDDFALLGSTRYKVQLD